MEEAVPREDRQWTVRDAADYFQVSEATIYAYIRDKGLPFYKFGTRLRADPDDVRNWVRMLRDQQQAEVDERTAQAEEEAELARTARAKRASSGKTLRPLKSKKRRGS